MILLYVLNRLIKQIYEPRGKKQSEEIFISQSYSVAKRQDFTVDTVTTQTIKAWA